MKRRRSNSTESSGLALRSPHILGSVLLVLTRSPPGRSVSACQKAFGNLCTRVFQVPLQPLGPVAQLSPSSKARKRPAPGAETPAGPNRELQPRTPGFATVNEPVEPTAYPPGLVDSGDQRKKKRGRPSKAEIEVKAAEYAARGEPYPPPRKTKTPKTPAERAATIGPPITFTPVTMGPSGAEGSPAGKKRTPKAKAQQDDPVPGYGPAASSMHQFRSEIGVPNPTPGTTFQASQPEPSDPITTGVSPAAQGQPTEGRSVTESHQHQGVTQLAPSEGFGSREEASSEYRHESGNDASETRSTAHQQTTAEHGSPNVMHSAGQRE